MTGQGARSPLAPTLGETFFLPSFCGIRMVFAVVVVAQLLAFILVLASPWQGDKRSPPTSPGWSATPMSARPTWNGRRPGRDGKVPDAAALARCSATIRPAACRRAGPVSLSRRLRPP